MTLSEFVRALRDDPRFMENVTEWRVLPAREAKYAPFPQELDARIVQVLKARGIERLYTHQRQALDCALAGRDFVVVTPTASGKTLCYNLPVLNAILKDDAARAVSVSDEGAFQRSGGRIVFDGGGAGRGHQGVHL